MTFKQNLGPSLYTAALVASLAIVPVNALAKDKKGDRRSQEVLKLEAENAQLRQQLAALLKERDQLKAATPPAATQAVKAPPPPQNPFALKDLDKGYGNTAMTGATPTKSAKEMACGARMMKGGEMRCGANMMSEEMAAMEPGSQMQMNPVLAGMDFFHIHPKGMWMFNTKFMHVDQRGLGAGTKNVPLSAVLPDRNGPPRSKAPYNYMMAPTYMTMDMFMLMPMVGVTDRLTVMAMANYMDMNMGMKMGMGNDTHFARMSPMRTSGVSDTEVDATYAVTDRVFTTLGLTIPTGSIKQEVEMMGRTFRAPYDMQNGTGTFAFKPALSYHDLDKDNLWMWGGQATYTAQVGRNSQRYSRGDNVKVTAFLQRAFGPATGFLHLTFNHTDRIQGEDPMIAKINLPSYKGGASMPDADPRNYGGQRLDAQIGFSYEKGPFNFGVEGGVPVYQYLNGLQLKTTWMLNAGFQAMF